MNRLQFLKSFILGLATLFIFPKLLFARKFRSDLYYGEWVKIFDEDLRDKATEFIYRRIIKVVPAQYRNKKYIKTIHKKLGWAGTFDPLRQWGSVAWKYTPEKSLLSRLQTGKRIYFKDKEGKLIATNYLKRIYYILEKDPWYGWGNNAEKAIRIFR